MLTQTQIEYFSDDTLLLRHLGNICVVSLNSINCLSQSNIKLTQKSISILCVNLIDWHWEALLGLIGKLCNTTYVHCGRSSSDRSWQQQGHLQHSPYVGDRRAHRPSANVYRSAVKDAVQGWEIDLTHRHNIKAVNMPLEMMSYACEICKKWGNCIAYFEVTHRKHIVCG